MFQKATYLFTFVTMKIRRQWYLTTICYAKCINNYTVLKAINWHLQHPLIFFLFFFFFFWSRSYANKWPLSASLFIRIAVSVMVVQVFFFFFFFLINREAWTCFVHLISSILLISLTYFCLYGAHVFPTGSTLASSKTSPFLLGPNKLYLLYVSWISSLLSLVFLYPFVQCPYFTAI